MLFVHRSNRVERLVEALGDVVAESPPGPFEAETIIVQGRGMERWLSMELSRRFGVWANPAFPFPRGYLLGLFRDMLGADEEALRRYEPESLTWAVAARLPALLDRPAFGPLSSYLARQPGAARLLSLSDRIARTFDDYVVFRPRMIEGWQERCDGTWQSQLWRRLVDDFGDVHVAALAKRLVERLEREPSAESTPARISIFGVSTLAPLYLEIFAKLALVTQVHLFVLSPSHQYWADLQSRRVVVRRWSAGETGEDEDLDTVLAREEGNRLLASLGRIGREFQGVLEATADYQDAELYDDPGEVGGDPTALQVLQSDMLELIHRSPRSEDQPRPFEPADDSIVVHSCHGPMREVQVLYDQLRGMFDRDPSLRPRDVIVMTPDIDAYAPFIEAVFEGSAGAGIPHRIADRKPSATSDIFDAFREVLAVLGGRMTATEIVDLLRLAPLRRQLGFSEGEIEVAREWVDRVAVRWGMDAEHRSELGHPRIDQNTWEFGLRRLFLGYAMGDGTDLEFADTAGYSDIEGGDAEVLGKLAELCERLFGAARRLREPQKIATWPNQIRQLLDQLFSQEGAPAYQSQAIRSAVDSIVQRAEAAGFEGEVDLASVADLIDRELRTDSLARGFLSGAVTFCELVPMRSIPFEVVCLIGMNDDAFPRVDRRPDFDLIGQHRRWGDRSRRDDDRYMFLEAVLSARRRLYLSYQGQSVQTQEAIPPSVVVQELLDTLNDSFTVAGPDGCAADSTIRRHPLQAFSPNYFQGESGTIRSYSRAAYRGALALVEEPQAPPPFVTRAVERGEDQVVQLDEVVRFFENPTRAFLQNQLRLFLGRDQTTLSTREPVDLNALERWKVADPILRRLLDGRPVAFENVARLGELPAGALGRREFDHLLVSARQIASEAGPVRSFEAVEVDLTLGEERLLGVLPRVGESGQDYYQYSNLGGRQELALWIRHLAYCLARPESVRKSRLFGRSGSDAAAVVELEAVADADAVLSDLLGLYRSGLERPLPLFEQASRAYARAIAAGKEPAAARSAAEARFGGDRGDVRDVYVRQLYGEDSPFSSSAPAAERAATVATTVYGRFLAAAETRRL